MTGRCPSVHPASDVRCDDERRHGDYHHHTDTVRKWVWGDRSPATVRVVIDPPPPLAGVLALASPGVTMPDDDAPDPCTHCDGAGGWSHTTENGNGADVDVDSECDRRGGSGVAQ